MGLQETIRKDFSIRELQRLTHHTFVWQWLPAAGLLVGILLRVREDVFLIEDMDTEEFFFSMSITYRRMNLSLEVNIVYGPADPSSRLKRKVQDMVELLDTLTRYADSDGTKDVSSDDEKVSEAKRGAGVKVHFQNSGRNKNQGGQGKRRPWDGVSDFVANTDVGP
ncbi:hypothetical protein D1007_23074 [Hordeum vulgare]|nr:hypothetical protein D1007_23074 [Hordeum vulgare]